MVLDAAAGGVLIAGAAMCAVLGLRERAAQAPRLLFAAALAFAGAGVFAGAGERDELELAACVLAFGGVLLVLERSRT